MEAPEKARRRRQSAVELSNGRATLRFADVDRRNHHSSSPATYRDRCRSEAGSKQPIRKYRGVRLFVWSGVRRAIAALCRISVPRDLPCLRRGWPISVPGFRVPGGKPNHPNSSDSIRFHTRHQTPFSTQIRRRKPLSSASTQLFVQKDCQTTRYILDGCIRKPSDEAYSTKSGI